MKPSVLMPSLMVVTLVACGNDPIAIAERYLGSSDVGSESFSSEALRVLGNPVANDNMSLSNVKCVPSIRRGDSIRVRCSASEFQEDIFVQLIREEGKWRLIPDGWWESIEKLAMKDRCVAYDALRQLMRASSYVAVQSLYCRIAEGEEDRAKHPEKIKEAEAIAQVLQNDFASDKDVLQEALERLAYSKANTPWISAPTPIRKFGSSLDPGSRLWTCGESGQARCGQPYGRLEKAQAAHTPAHRA